MWFLFYSLWWQHVQKQINIILYEWQHDHMMTQLYWRKEQRNHFLNRFSKTNCSKEPFRGNESDFPSLTLTQSAHWSSCYLSHTDSTQLMLSVLSLTVTFSIKHWLDLSLCVGRQIVDCWSGCVWDYESFLLYWEVKHTHTSRVVFVFGLRISAAAFTENSPLYRVSKYLSLEYLHCLMIKYVLVYVPSQRKL